MNIGVNTIRLLGVVQLLVIIGGVISVQLHGAAIGSGSFSERLVNISNNLTLWRISNLATLLNSCIIIVLGVLFYNVFNEEYKVISLVALTLFIAEGITLAVSTIGAIGLIPLSQEFVKAGTPELSYFQTQFNFLYYGFDKLGYDIHMLFFWLGGILWYYLFYVSMYIPRWLSGWGLASVCLMSIPVLLTLYDRDFLTAARVLYLPYLPFELVLGVWLIVKGFN
jgi:hypothetical protein